MAGNSSRHCLYVANGIFLILGLTILAVGLWAKFDENFEDRGLGDIKNWDNGFITIGSIVSVVSVIGFLGAALSRPCNMVLLSIYFVILLLLSLAAFATAIFLFMDPYEQHTKKTETGNEMIDEKTNEIKKKYFKFMWEDAVKTAISKCSITELLECKDKVHTRMVWISRGFGVLALLVSLAMFSGCCMTCVLCCAVACRGDAV